MRKFLCSLLLVALLLGCEPVGNRIVEEFDKSDQTIHLTVVFHPNLTELNGEYHKRANDVDEGLLGFSFWDRTSDPYVCEIHVVKPYLDGDERMMTMGHELMHCLVGKYH